MNVIFMRKKSLALTLMLAFSCLLGGGDLMGQKTLPYSYGFENNSLADEGWTVSTGSNGAIYKGNSPHNGDYHFRFRSTGSADTYQYLFSPELPSSVGLNVQFYYYRTGTVNMTFNVGYSTTNTDPGSFTFLETDITVSNTSYNDNILFSHDFNVTNIKYIAIKYTNFTGTWVYLYIDDITISEISSSCTIPTDLSAEATSSTTANVSWTAGSTETAWQLYYSNVGYATPYNASEGDFITINTTPSYTLTGLTPNTEHFVYVRAKCGEDDYSDWTDAESFTTLNPQSLPVTNDFEDGEDDLEDWTMRDTNANTGVYDSETYGSSSYCFRFYSSTSGSTQHLITPELSGTTNGVYVQFYRKQPYAGAWIQVGYSTETNSTADFTWSDATPNAAATRYVYYELNCPAGTKFVAIKYTSTTSTPVYIDDISITVPPTATTNGNWNNTATWATGAVPSSSANVVISSAVTIPNGYTATANNITIDGGSLTIADGGQLVCNNAVQATVQKSITGYGEGNDKWYFIASPINVDNLAPTNVSNMLSNNYDLYQLDNTTWENYKEHEGNAHPLFELANGRGYLYANSANVDLAFVGTTKPYDAEHTISVSEGWNLIGNPYTFEAYPNQAYYTITDANSGITAQTSTSDAAVAPCTGIIVKAAEDGTVKFLNEAPASSANNGNLQMVLAHKVATRDGASVNKTIDNAIVSFNEGGQLEKFHFGNPAASIFIPQNGEDYAIAFSDRQGDVPLNFKANETGTYTISFAGDEMELNGIHLIDILAEEEIDLSVNPSYTFIGSPADRAERFVIRFENSEQSENSVFAYQSGSDIVVTGEGELQIFDVMGRMVSRQYVSGVETINAMPYGVYIFKLNGMTQKIVVR